MTLRFLPLAAAALVLALASGNAQAQLKKTSRSASRVVPVLNKDSGKLEAVLLLEPATAGVGGRLRFGKTTLEATYGVQAGDSLAMLCDRKTGLSAAIGQLANNCVMATLDRSGNVSRHSSAGLSLNRGGGRLGLSIGSGNDTLPAWLSSSQLPAKVQSSDFSLLAEKTLGSEAFVSVGGTVARARLVPAADMPRFADQWNTRSLSIGGGYGAFGANIVGRVVNVPGENEVWKGLGLGLTWRTPWNGQLSVGADNLVTRGKNPFSLKGDQADEGTVPYVRYQQDL